MRSRLLRSTAVFLFLPAAMAMDPAPAPAATLASLLVEALDRNPEILAAQKAYEAARQRPSQAGSLPDPMFSPGFNASGRPWPGAGLGREPTSSIGFLFSQQVPFPGKRKLQGEMAAKEAEAEFQLYQQVQLSVISRLKQAWYRRAYAGSALEVIRRNIELLRRMLEIAEIRYSVGKALQQDVFQGQTRISILEAKRLQLERELAAREAEIASLVSRPPGIQLAAAQLPEPPRLEPALNQLYASAREQSPLLLRQEMLIQRAELAVNAARKEYYPDMAFRGGYFNMGGMPDMYQFSVDFRIPLYFFRKQRPGVAERAQLLTVTRKGLEAASRSLEFRIQDDYLMAQTAMHLLKLYAGTVIPQASLALESSLAAYETGKGDFRNVLANAVTVFEYEMNYYEELQNCFLALARLEELTAMRLIP